MSWLWCGAASRVFVEVDNGFFYCDRSGVKTYSDFEGGAVVLARSKLEAHIRSETFKEDLHRSLYHAACKTKQGITIG